MKMEKRKKNANNDPIKTKKGTVKISRSIKAKGGRYLKFMGKNV